MEEKTKKKKYLFIILFVTLIVVSGCTNKETINSNSDEETTGVEFDVNINEEITETIIGLGISKIIAENVVVNFSDNSFAQNVNLEISKVDSLSGSELDDVFLDAVHFYDSGINLLEPAEIIFELPGDVLQKNIMAFGSEELADGTKELYFIPLEIKDNKAIVRVTEFSDYGILNISKSEVGRYLKVINPVDKHHKMLQEIASSDEGISDILGKWFKDKIYPDLQEAEYNDDVILRALRQYTSWLTYAQTTGLDDNLTEQINKALKSITKSTKNAIDNAHETCISDKDPLEVSTMIFWLKAAQLFGIEKNDLGEMEIKIRGCARFEITLESTFTSQYYISDTTGSLIIELNDDMTSWTGEGTRHQSVSGWGGTICEDNQENEYNLNVPWATVQMKSLPGGKAAVKIDAVIEPDNGVFMPEASYACSGPGYSMSFTNYDEYLSDFAIMHEDDYVGPESVGLYGKVFPETSYRISGWTYVGTQDSFGERSYTSIKEGITEESMFRLRHAPLSN